MFDFQFEINGVRVSGLFALALIATPFIACIFLGIMIGLSL